MTEPTLEFIAEQQRRILDRLKTIEDQLDVLARKVTQVDHAVEALHENIRSGLRRLAEES